MEHSHDRQQGFSLLEVMIALAIFSIATVALYGIQTITISQNFSARQITTANAWGAKKLEDLMALKYEDVKDRNGEGFDGLGNDTPPDPDDPGAPEPDYWEFTPDGVYTVMWNVAERIPLDNTKTVRVIVTSQRTGTGDRVELQYIKHDPM